MNIFKSRIGAFPWWAFLAALALAGDIQGKVQLEKNGDPKPIDEEDEIVIFINRHEAPISDRILTDTYTMVTQKKQFSPRMLVIPLGGTVRFPNLDPIIHNVFSVSGKNRFDAGRFSKGEGTSVTFKHPGMVRIYCNVHHQMNATIHVVENPYFTRADSEGRFSIKNVAAGTYQLTAVHYLGAREQQEVTLTQTTAPLVVDLTLSLVKKKVKPHLNKFGKPYKRKRAKRY